jgi:hypothetical protein
VTANLATQGTGTLKPGTFFGRSGPGPDAALSAADAVTHALAGLEPEPGTPLAAYLLPLARVQDSVRWLAAGLGLEARMAAEALIVDLSLPEPDAAQAVRQQLTAAARGTLAAADQVRASWRALNRELRGREDADPGGGRLARRATAAADRIGDLKTELTQALARPVPASLPMVDGHSQLTDTVVLIMAHLWRVCGQFRSGITDAYADLGREAAAKPKAARVTGPLDQVPADLRRAARDVVRAHAVLASACTQIRKAPPGFPCSGCGGSGRSRLTGGTCTCCRGGGTDPYAMRQ